MSGQQGGQGLGGRSRGDMLGIAIAVVVGLAIGLGGFRTEIGVKIGLLFLLSVPVGMVVVFVVLFRRYSREVASVPVGEVPCPRCGHEPRTAAGWCPSCTELLASTPARADHPFHRFAAALATGDIAAAARQIDDHVTLSLPNGVSRRVTRGGWRRTVRINMWIYHEQRSEQLGLHADPADSGVLWTRTRDAARARPGFQDVDAERITRYRFTHDLISEVENFPALPKA